MDSKLKYELWEKNGRNICLAVLEEEKIIFLGDHFHLAHNSLVDTIKELEKEGAEAVLGWGHGSYKIDYYLHEEYNLDHARKQMEIEYNKLTDSQNITSGKARKVTGDDVIVVDVYMHDNGYKMEFCHIEKGGAHLKSHADARMQKHDNPSFVTKEEVKAHSKLKKEESKEKSVLTPNRIKL